MATVKRAPNPPGIVPGKPMDILAEADQEILSILRRIESLLANRTPHIELVGVPQPKPNTLSLPSQLATILAFMPEAKELSDVFLNASVVARGRGSTTTFSYNTEQAPKLLALLKAANDRQSHRDLARGIVEVEKQLV